MAEQPFPSLPFHHEPLPSKSSIRLVSLVHDASGDLPPMIQGVPLIRLSLTAVDLKDNPYYDTLSYTWGSPFWEGSDKSKFYHGADSLRPVAVNNRIYYIGRNLWEFLHQAKQTISNPRHHPNPDVEKRYKKYNKTAIIIAAENGRLHRVKKYIRLGADLGAQDKFGETALHYAAENGHLDIVKLLVNHGSDINLRDSTNRTPLDCAIQRERGAFKEVIDFLQNAKDFPPSRNLRKDLPLSDRCPLWIDSICIDQGNILERNAQVAMMSEIYSHAESVIVWLGVEDEYAAPAFEAIEKIEEENTEKSPSFMAWLTYIYTGSTAIFDAEVVAANILASLNYPRKIVKDGVAISHLLERTWWSRVWIVQELALSKEVLMVCGSLQIDFLDTFVFQLPTFRVPDSFTDLVGSPSVVYALQAARFADVKGIEACVLSEIKLRKSADKDKSQWVSPNGNELLSITPIPHDENKLSIQVLGTMTRWFQASDPRDHVFALLGISGTGGKDHGIIADYSMSTAELFVKYGRLFMQGSPDEPVKSLHTTELYTFECLEGLSYVQTNPKSHPRFQDYKTRLPSWTPNFSVPLVTHRIWSDQFNSSPALPGTPIIFPSAATDELRLNGAKYDEVVAIEPMRKEYGDYHILLPLAWLEFILPLHPIYVGGGNRIDALWRTLTANRVQGAATSKRVGFRDFMRRNLWYAAMDSQCAPLVHSLLLQLRQADSRDTLPAAEEIEAPPARVRKNFKLYLDLNATFPSAWRRYYASRCLYRTKRGYIGLGPEETNPGDEVWLIAGARTPFTLRKPDKKKPMKGKWLLSLRNSFHFGPGRGDAEEHRVFVGESYVHGLMDGEAAGNVVFNPVSLV